MDINNTGHLTIARVVSTATLCMFLEEILEESPGTVYSVSKMMGSKIMKILTIFGSTLHDYVEVGSVTLKVKSLYAVVLVLWVSTWKVLQ